MHQHLSGWLPFAVFLVFIGCGFNTYRVSTPNWSTLEARRNQKLSDKIAVPAIRESDSKPMRLLGSSLRKDRAQPEGTEVRVRSNRARKHWLAAGIVTGLGGAMAISGAILGVSSFSPEGSRRGLGNAGLLAGLIIGPIGDFMVLVASPIMFGVAASRERNAQEFE